MNSEEVINSAVEVRMEPLWKEKLAVEFNKEYFLSLKLFLEEERRNGYKIYPSGNRIFAAFDLTPFNKIKAVIIGQDPYHGEGQANGLCFSVNDGIRVPPSLINIYKELQSDIGIPVPATGNLEPWARQGVLLLNATLTVRQNEAGSHQQKGWETFTDTVIKTISREADDVVFLLWGKYAQAKEELIDSTKHLVLKAAHPSPFSADKGFFGCKHFSKTNEYLVKQGKQPINWKLLTP